MRNDHLFQLLLVLPQSVRYKTLHAIFQQNLSHIIPLTGLAPGLPRDIWLPPMGQYVKLNFDGSFSSLSEHAGIGGIIRNASGHLLAAFSSQVRASHSIEAELQALITGVDPCLQLGHRAVIFEGDCLILVENLSSCNNLQWSFMNNWRILIKKLKQLFWWEIRFRRRTTNTVADALSQLATPLMTVFTDTLPHPAQEPYPRDLCHAALYNLKFAKDRRPTHNMHHPAPSTSTSTSHPIYPLFSKIPDPHLRSFSNLRPVRSCSFPASQTSGRPFWNGSPFMRLLCSLCYSWFPV